ncbi:MAG: histidinol-phosphate transaminase [Clostridia bacterium]|nr:histidinol-phosphate transaminase [Clostridia bacterium]
MKTFLMPVHRALPAYVPGTHEESGNVIRLNTNESPYPPSPEVLGAIASESSKLNFYNDPDCTVLIEALSAHLGVGTANILAGNGSDQILQLAFLAFADGDNPVTLPDVTYSYYDLFAALYGIPLRRIKLEPDFSMNPAAWQSAEGMLVFPNPNAPTGLALQRSEIEGMLQAHPDQVVLVDEAYVDFGAETAVPLIRQYPNLLVVRTFSKSGSLAGIRLGYAVGSESLIADLAKVRNAVDLYGVNRLAQAAGTAACRHWTYYEENCRRIVDARRETTEGLRALGFTVTDSLGNFVFVRPARISASDLQKRLMDRGILVRHFKTERTNDWLRITIGTMDEMKKLLDACREILNGQEECP